MTATTPRFKTTVDQDRGPHSSGARYTQLIDVITDFSDYSQAKWDELSSVDREWWTDRIEEIHEARVALAELPQETRSRAEDRITDEECDVDNAAGVIRRIVAEESGSD